MPRTSSGRRDPFAIGKARTEKPIPHAFVLDELASQNARTNPMFGCLAVYVGERIVFMLRDKGASDTDNGVWISFEAEKREAVQERFPRAEQIDVFSGRVSGWLKFAAKSRDFEDDVMEACALVRANDPLLGKVPNGKRGKAKAGPAPTHEPEHGQRHGPGQERGPNPKSKTHPKPKPEPKPKPKPKRPLGG